MAESKFQYVRPNDWEEAFSYLNQPNHTTMPFLIGAKPVALTNLNTNTLVDLSKLDLDYIRPASDGSIQIGLLTPLEDLIHAPEFQRQPYQILAEAAYQVAPSGLRNLATLGGAIQSHSGSPEVILALFVLGAELVMRTKSGMIRTTSLQRHYNGITREGASEIMVEVHLPAFPEGCGAALERVGRTPRDEAIVATAALIQLQNDQTCMIRLAAAGISRQPSFVETTGVLREKAVSKEDLQKAVSQIMETDQPYHDYRGSGNYRQAIAGVLARRALETAGNQTIR